MNKAQLVEALAQRLGEDKKRAAQSVEALLDTVYRTVQKGEKVAITGFGVFEKRERAARMARNPSTGEKVRVKKTSVPAFRAGQEFKDIVNGSKKLTKLPAVKATKAATAGTTTRRAAAGTATKATTTRTAATKATAAKTTATRATAAKKAPAKTAAKAPAKRTTAKAPARKAPAKRSS